MVLTMVKRISIVIILSGDVPGVSTEKEPTCTLGTKTQTPHSHSPHLSTQHMLDGTNLHSLWAHFHIHNTGNTSPYPLDLSPSMDLYMQVHKLALHKEHLPHPPHLHSPTSEILLKLTPPFPYNPLPLVPLLFLNSLP